MIPDRRIVTVYSTDSGILYKKASPVTLFNKELKNLLRDMVFRMKELDAYGLAAPQIGIGLQVFVAEYPKGTIYTIINPSNFEYIGDEEEGSEACLSIPNYSGIIKRSLVFKMDYVNLKRKKETIETTGFLARIFQHEIDHLLGRLYIDKTFKVFRR